MDVAQQFASEGVAQRSVVLTPVPAFGSSVYRFLPQNSAAKTSQFAAAPDTPHCTQAQGCTSTADNAQSRRPAKSTHTTSYMAPPSTLTLPSSSLLDLVLRSTNEMRLQELYDLYHRRKLIGPGPGEHDAKLLKAKQSHHRPHLADRDGPQILDSQHVSTRAREMEQQLSRNCPGSGLGPGHYDGALSKDNCLRNGKTGGRIGSAVRGGAKGLVAYAPSVSSLISQQVNASQELDSNMLRTEFQTEFYNSVQPKEVDKLSLAPTTVQASPSGPTVIACAPCGFTPCAKPTACKKEKAADAGHLENVQGNRDIAPKAARLESGKHQHNKSLPKHPPCPPQLLASASHCDSPGDWDWSSLNRSSLQSFSSQNGGCHCNSRTALESKVDTCKRFELDLQKSREGPPYAAIGQSGGHSTLSKNMTPIPENGTVATSFKGRKKRHKSLTNYGYLVSEKEIRSHELAKSHAEEVIAVDARRRQWELYSSMYSTVLPLLKKQIAMGTTYSQME